MHLSIKTSFSSASRGNIQSLGVIINKSPLKLRNTESISSNYTLMLAESGVMESDYKGSTLSDPPYTKKRRYKQLIKGAGDDRKHVSYTEIYVLVHCYPTTKGKGFRHGDKETRQQTD